MPRERMTELLKIAHAQQSNNGIADAENNCAQRVLLFRIEGDCTTGEREQGDRQPYFGVIVTELCPIRSKAVLREKSPAD